MLSLILIISIGIKASSLGIGSVPAFVAALLVMATCPATTFLCWFLSVWDIVQVRSLLVICAALSIMCSGAVLHQEALDFNSSSDQTRSTRIGIIFALVTVIAFQIMFLVHRARTFTQFKIESGFPLEKSLSEPTLRDDAISWVYTPSSYSSLSTLLKLSLCCLMISWCVYAGALGTFKAGDLYPPIQVHSVFVLATFYAAIGLSGHVFLQWKHFGLVGTISAAVSFSSFGCVMYSAAKSPGSMLLIASALLCAAFLTIATVVLLHKSYPPVSRNEIFAIQHTLLIGLICFGWIGCIVAIGLRRGGGAPAYTLVSVCGLLAIIGLIVEKSRPGVVVHGLLRGSNVFGCIATLSAAGTSFSSDAEQIQGTGVGSIIDIASSALLTAGAALYLLSVFAYSIQRHGDLARGHSLLHRDDKFGSTLAVTGSAVNLEEAAEAFGSTATLASSSDEQRRSSEDTTSSSNLEQQSDLVSSQGKSTDSLDSTATNSTEAVSKRSSIFERLKAMSSSSFASSQTSIGDRKREQKKGSFFDRFKRKGSATDSNFSQDSILTSKQPSRTDMVGTETREGNTLPSPSKVLLQPASTIITPYNTSANDLGPRDSIESLKL
ncbi:hypothetical protein HDU81_007390 [Chytriomyces hyalinus]|nr:hypothetical protein HDU81_007390 [Chytriomyces hyalinus]